MINLLKNDQGQISGAKLILILAAGLTAAFLIRDLCAGRELTESHVALSCALLLIGLINRVSARGTFRLSLGRNGAEIEVNNGRDKHY